MAGGGGGATAGITLAGVSCRGRAGGVGFAIIGAAGAVTAAGGVMRGGLTAGDCIRVLLAVCLRRVAFGSAGARCGARNRDRGIVVGGSFSAARLLLDGFTPMSGRRMAGGVDGSGSVRYAPARGAAVDWGAPRFAGPSRSGTASSTITPVCANAALQTRMAPAATTAANVPRRIR